MGSPSLLVSHGPPKPSGSGSSPTQSLSDASRRLKRQFDQKLVEPNSGLGQAIQYMLNHWEKLTRFLQEPGAPLDNNICERALKRAILHRKNALFYKTRRGARVGDMYMSLIYTSEFGPTYDEFEFIDNMAIYEPKTSLKQGDLVLLRFHQVDPLEAYPKIWQVRFVVSKYAHDIHEIVHSNPGIGFDHAHDFLRISADMYCLPMLYCHAFPHGLYPDTCMWFEGYEVKKLMFRAHTEQWEPILDEFETPFLGYDTTGLGASFHLDLAPDRYSNASRRTSMPTTLAVAR